MNIDSDFLSTLIWSIYRHYFCAVFRQRAPSSVVMGCVATLELAKDSRKNLKHIPFPKTLLNGKTKACIFSGKGGVKGMLFELAQINENQLRHTS